MSVLRVAVVGVGHQGTKHVQSYASLEGVEIVAVVERDARRLETVCERFGIPVSGRLRSHDLLSAGLELDLVSICTLPSTHEEIALAALDAGANVLCEKPIAPSAEAVERMVAAAAQRGRVLTGALNMRYMGSAQLARRLVEDGTLGPAISLSATCLDTGIPWWGPHYLRDLSGGGVVASDAAHVVDLALWAAGWPSPSRLSASMVTSFPRKRGGTAPSAEIAARYDVEDMAGGFIRLEGGGWLTLELGWTADLPEPIFGFEMQCEQGSFRLDPFRIVVERDGTPVDVTSAYVGDNDWEASVGRGIAAVVDALLSGQQPLVGGDELVLVQRLIDAIYRSAELGLEVDLLGDSI